MDSEHSIHIHVGTNYSSSSHLGRPPVAWMEFVGEDLFVFPSLSIYIQAERILTWQTSEYFNSQSADVAGLFQKSNLMPNTIAPILYQYVILFFEMCIET